MSGNAAFTVGIIIDESVRKRFQLVYTSLFKYNKLTVHTFFCQLEKLAYVVYNICHRMVTVKLELAIRWRPLTPGGKK